MKNKKIFENDLNTICSATYIDFNQFNGKTVFITGATGLIGFTLVSVLLHYGENTDNPPKVIAFVRNLEKAKKMYRDAPQKNFNFMVGDVTQRLTIEQPIDYIIHAASRTSSKAFVSEPVETIQTAINGTVNMLDLAKEKNVRSFIYLSSMEVYGSPSTDEKILENHGTNLDTMSVRTSYPESKRMCENISTSYYHEYGVPTKVIRLTQTFGPGVSYDDNRVFAEFMRCAIEKRDIILHTSGETKRSYLYTADAATAIFTVLLNGKNGEAYNAANENTYCSIYEMAELVANTCANGEIAVKFDIEDESKFGYAPTLKMNLDTHKLKALGWKANENLLDMFLALYQTILKE